MGRRSPHAESMVGRFIGLPVAAHLARTHLAREPLTLAAASDLEHVADAVASALVRVLPVYCTADGVARELTAAELEGARVAGGGRRIVLRDGRELSGIVVRRADLRQAIALLKAVDIPEVR